MKNGPKFKLFSLVMVVVLALSILSFSSVSAADSSSSVYPTSIAGLPVILVETNANDIAIPSGDVTLVLLDNTSSTIQESSAKLNLNNYL